MCPCYSCRPSQHIQWYFHMCMFHIHIFHIFTFFIIVPLTPHYSINYYYCLFEYIGCLPFLYLLLSFIVSIFTWTAILLF